MRMRTRLTAAALLAATTFGLAAAPGAPAGADETPVPQSKAGSKVFSFSGWIGNAMYNTETFTAPGEKPVIGNFAGNTLSDILWYTPGAGGDALWTFTGAVGHTSSAVSVGGTYTPKVGTFATPDGYDDIVWYSSSSTSQLWDYNANGTVTKTPLPGVTGPGQLLVGDFALDGIDDIIRYRPGVSSDSWFDFQQVQVQSRPFNVNGTYTPLVGTFAGDGSADIFWYKPGSGIDPLWDFDGGGAKTQWDLIVNGTYTPVVGGFSGDGKDDVIWYKAGSGPDSVWDFDGSGYVTQSLAVNGTYAPVACACLNIGSPGDDVVWYGAGGAGDVGWKMTGQEPLTYTSMAASMWGTSVAGKGFFDNTSSQLLLIRH